MTDNRYDVTGIGSAIVDIIGRCDDAFLQKFGKTKGAMQLVDTDEIGRIYAAMGPAVEVSGGSVANTIAGIASFGGNAAFIGNVADDEFGRIFTHDIRSIGVTFNATPVSGRTPTSRSLILVTPDGERTMNTYLGISTEFEKDQIDVELISKSAVLYLEGYLFDRDDAKQAFREAAAIAKAHGTKVALTLSDSFCVDRHRAEFLNLIRSGVDILFANESEITSLYQTPDFDSAAANINRDTSLAVLTRSEKGSLILEGNDRVEIAVEPVEKVVDATGAGDLYAAGFLYGYTRALPNAISGRLASIAAAEIISHIGARPMTPVGQLARDKGLKI